jgi:non-specific serine/threonine protein kinase
MLPARPNWLARYAQLYSRVGFVHQFHALSGQELQGVIEHQWVQLGFDIAHDRHVDTAVINAIARVTRGNFRLVQRLYAQIGRIVTINNLPAITTELVTLAREAGWGSELDATQSTSIFSQDPRQKFTHEHLDPSSSAPSNSTWFVSNEYAPKKADQLGRLCSRYTPLQPRRLDVHRRQRRASETYSVARGRTESCQLAVAGGRVGVRVDTRDGSCLVDAASEVAAKEAGLCEGGLALEHAGDTPAGGHNLRADISTFVGRQREVAEVAKHLESVRLLTLTGTGGIGKSRLAMRVAERAHGRYADGVWLVEFASLADAAVVPRAVCWSLGLAKDPGRQALDALVEFARPRSLLLVLDNCEHLVAACADLADYLLRECPRLQILATSREPFEITGETVWPVPPLSMPDLTRLDLGSLARSEAVTLFAERAASARPDFVLMASNAAAIGKICQRLDGIPLALELAAARTTTLSVEHIAEHLDSRFALLVRGSRTAPPRHQTLQAAFDWSYDFLPTAEQALFRRLAIFAGSWTLEAASAIAREDVTELLARLVEKSLVQSQVQDGQTRYRFLETVRQYAQHKLIDSGEDDDYRRHHLDWWLDLAEKAEPALWSAAQWDWVSRLQPELDNLHAVLAWCQLSAERAELGVRLAGALWHFWNLMSDLLKADKMLGALLAISAEPTPARARALSTFGWQSYLRGAGPPREDTLQESQQLSVALGMPREASIALSGQALARLARGDFGGARRLNKQALAVARTARDKVGIWAALWGQAEIARQQGDSASAAALLEESLCAARDLDDAWSTCQVEEALVRVALERGDFRRAQSLCEDNLRQGQHRALARADYHVLFWLEALGWIASAHGQARRAAWLLGGVAAARERRGFSLHVADREQHERSVAAVRARDAAAFDAIWSEAQATTAADLVKLALTPGQSGVGFSPDALPDRLTPREAEVLRMIAEGRSNHEIAGELALSVRTVERHITNLYAKIKARGKAEATAYAFRHGLQGPE